MADVQLTASIVASSDTSAQGGIRFSVSSTIKGPTPKELLRAIPLPPPPRLPSGEEVVMLRPVRRA